MKSVLQDNLINQKSKNMKKKELRIYLGSHFVFLLFFSLLTAVHFHIFVNACHL